MSEIIKYKPEFILKFKNECNLNNKINDIFDTVLELMSSSTDQKNFKAKISKNIELNSNKWHRKRFITDDEKCKMKINSCLNRYSHITYKEVTLDILKLDFGDLEITNYFLKTFITKYILDHGSDIWNYMLEKLIFSNITKWKLNGRYMIEYLIDNIQNNFNEITEEYQSKLENLWKNDIDTFYLIKRKNMGLMKLIAELFKFEIIKRDTITSVLKNLTLNINQFYKLELGVGLIKYIYNYISKDEKNKFLEYFSIYLKDKNLNIKVKFMILDFIENNSKIDNSKNKNEFYTDEQVETIIKNSVDEYLNDKELSSFYESISKIKLPNKSNKLIYYYILNLLDNDLEDILVELLEKILTNKLIKFNNLKYGLIDFINDYEEFKWDYNDLNMSIKSLLNKLKDIKILTDDNVNFIISKIDENIKESLSF